MEASQIVPESTVLYFRNWGSLEERVKHMSLCFFQFIPFSLKSSVQVSCPLLVSHLRCIVRMHQIHLMYMQILFVQNDMSYKSTNFRRKLWCWFFYVFIKIFSHRDFLIYHLLVWGHGIDLVGFYMPAIVDCWNFENTKLKLFNA